MLLWLRDAQPRESEQTLAEQHLLDRTALERTTPGDLQLDKIVYFRRSRTMLPSL